MTKCEFYQILQKICLAYRMPLNEKEADLYYEYLGGYSVEEFSLATNNIITSVKYEYFPRINKYKLECENARRELKYTQREKVSEELNTDIIEFFKSTKEKK